jgi:cyclase
LRVAAARAEVFFRGAAAGDRRAVVFFRPGLLFSRTLVFRLPLVFAVAVLVRFATVFLRAVALRRDAVLRADVRARAVLRAAAFFAAFFATLTSAVDYGAPAAGYDLPMLTRRHFLATSTATLAVTTLDRYSFFTRAFGQGQTQAPPPVTPVFKEIRRNTGYWTARGGTIGWLINPAGIVAVDSQFPDTAALCVDQLLKTSGKSEIAALINTHHHGDHTAGNGVFRPKTKQIIGHANVPKYMQSTYDQAVARRAQQNPPPTTPAPAEPVVPDKTLTDSMSVDLGDERITMKHYGPAHTGGDIMILFEKANVAHMGDLMFNRLHPVIDRVNGASIANWSVALDKIAKELPSDTIYIFGHAGENLPVTGARADLAHHSGYLAALLDYVRTQVKAGKTREQVVASTDTIKGFEDYGPLITRPLGPAFDEVSGI